MKIAIATQIKFWQRSQGSDQVIFNRFECFSGEKILIFIGKINKNDKKTLNSLDIRYVCFNSFVFNIFRLIRRVLVLIKMPLMYFFKKPFSFTLFDKIRINRILKREDINVLICEYIWISNLFTKLPKSVVKIIDTHDIQNNFCKLMRSIDNKWNKMVTLEEEMHIYSKFDFAIALSTADNDYFKKYINNSIYIPLVYKKQEFKDVDNRILSIGFIGGAATFNYEAINWFLDKVFYSLDNVVLNVYGNVCAFFTNKKYDNVFFHGKVQEIDEVYSNNHIMINPTFIIGGIKTKNVEALSYGRLVLTTSDGARGLEQFVEDGYVIVLNQPSEYIEKINSLKNRIDEINSIGTSIVSKFENEFSIKNIIMFQNKIEEIIKERKEND